MWQGDDDESLRDAPPSSMEIISEAAGSHRAVVMHSDEEDDFDGLLLPDHEPLHTADPPTTRVRGDVHPAGSTERGAGTRKDVRGGKGAAAAKKPKNLTKTMAAARKKWEVKTPRGPVVANGSRTRSLRVVTL